MPLILKGIVRPTLDGKFNVEINLTTNPRDLEILSTYRIPEVDYLSIYINDWSQNVKEFLSNNKIGSIKHFYFYNTAPYINLNSWMDVLMKTAKRVTIYFELAYWTIGTDGFATLFNSLTQESSLTLVLCKLYNHLKKIK